MARVPQCRAVATIAFVVLTTLADPQRCTYDRVQRRSA
jgi:hypothetical protein